MCLATLSCRSGKRRQGIVTLQATVQAVPIRTPCMLHTLHLHYVNLFYLVLFFWQTICTAFHICIFCTQRHALWAWQALVVVVADAVQIMIIFIKLKLVA